MPEDRRLAAIMFTDIVGYTALMGSDESKAFQLLRKNRDLQRPLIKKYRGEWLKEMGDGILASFHTSSDAVRCAGEIQNEAKKDVIPLRIGIHVGEVVFEGGDVLGDGVNVASRLEELAEEGCINISGAVYKDIKNKEGIEAEFIEEKALKNVEEPVKVYKVHCDIKEEALKELPDKTSNKGLFYIITGLAVLIIAFLIWQFLSYIGIRNPSVTDTSDRTIAVIPFWNDSPDPDNSYFCRGMEEAIRINLLKIADLQIESRQSVEKYRQNPEKDMITIGEELGVAFIVEGSVQKIDDDVRVNVQLIDARSGDHIWGETYDGIYTIKLLDFQSYTAKQIASSLNAVITPEEEERIERKPTTNIIAYDLILQAMDGVMKYWIVRDTRYLRLANKLIDESLEFDSQFIDALFVKGNIYVAENNYDSAYNIAQKILEIDHEFSGTYYLIGEYFRFKDSPDAAIENYQLFLENYTQGEFGMITNWSIQKWAEFLIGVLYIQDKHDYLKGFPYLQKGFQESFYSNSHYAELGYLSRIYLEVGDYERAEMYNKRMLEISSESIYWYIRNHCSILIFQGRFEESINFLDSICSITVTTEHICNENLIFANVYLEQFNEAERYFNQYVDANDSRIMWELDSVMIAFAFKMSGKDQKSKAILNSLRTSFENKISKDQSFYTLLNFALFHAVQNEKEESLKYLSQIVEIGQGTSLFDFVEYNPIFKDFRNNPDFKAIIKWNKEKLEKVRAQINEMRKRGELSI